MFGGAASEISVFGLECIVLFFYMLGKQDWRNWRNSWGGYDYLIARVSVLNKLI